MLLHTTNTVSLYTRTLMYCKDPKVDYFIYMKVGQISHISSISSVDDSSV